MLQASVIFLLLATSAFAAPANKIIRENDNPDEVVMIASCSKGSGGDMRTNDRIISWADDYARRNGKASQDTILQSAIKDPGRHDGMVYHVSWHAGTVENPVSGTFPQDGREFKVWGLPSDNSAKTDEPVAGSATLGGAPFKCYKGEGNLATTFQDGATCGSVFTCTRLERWIRKTEFLVDEQVTSGKWSSTCTNDIINAQDAFGKLGEAMKTPWETTTRFDIGGGCYIRFPVIDIPDPSPNFLDKTPQAIVDVMKNQFGGAIEKNRTMGVSYCALLDKDDKENNPNERRLQAATYPRGGSLQISVAQQSNPAWVTQTRVDFRVDCGTCKDDDRGLIPYISGSINTFGGFINPIFGATSAVMSLVDLGLGKC
ncbi:hypothetical protein HBI70_152740 [Parastagonospora nodorum]|nr:hypothetical protein HBH51_045780 [Parastagonospora nodorum]KAH4069915.1 hypothetical protein HBH50_106160 [Parastagonospora nodorum]KAH4090322.1 hypothetical protein HBH48_109930 [Parastagonospora nodorum]KAH5099152.1 hypothetical protein HBH71_237110 [Parastagonospora nodorum]KAH5264176.1 hypothetical protein HBI70_152740 [Parastagonospora nodorum]